MAYNFNSLDQATETFLDKRVKERNALFDQSDVAAEACTPENQQKFGSTEEDILLHIGRKAKVGETTMWGRLLVGRVFHPDIQHPLFPNGFRDVSKDLSWSHYYECARTWSEKTPDAPYEWLHTAMNLGLSVRRLKLKIAGKDSDPITHDVYLVDAELMEVDQWNDFGFTLNCLEPLDLPITPEPGMRVAVTVKLVPVIVKAPPDANREGG